METLFEAQGVQGMLHRPPGEASEALALTHGAGSNAGSPLLRHLARAFAEEGCATLRYDLPYRIRRASGPPHPSGAAEDREGVARAAGALSEALHVPVLAGGHSYGGRQTSIIAAERPGLAKALLLLSYPLHPPGRPEQMRTAHFPNLRTPALFVQGTQDPFASIEELRLAIAAIPAPTDVLVIEGAKHDLKRAGDMAQEILTRLRALASGTTRIEELL